MMVRGSPGGGGVLTLLSDGGRVAWGRTARR